MSCNQNTDCDDPFIGHSSTMQAIFGQIERAAQSEAAVFITGETGTGKELCAHTIHQQSRRKHSPFMALNCAAIPGELLESEVFGHVRGAFSGAVSSRHGAAMLANDGTLFLDEINELDIRLQPKLLRFLQTGEIRRVGASAVEKSDVRIICATNRVPWQDVQNGRLRADLYYRLNVISLKLPPLRRRSDDALRLAEYFLKHFNAQENAAFTHFSPCAEVALFTYKWPGNVRELKNRIHQAIIMHEGPMLTADMLDLPTENEPRSMQNLRHLEYMVSQAGHNNIADRAQRLPTLAEAERNLIYSALEECDGNVSRAATCLGVSPSTLYRKMQSWQPSKT